MTDIPRKLVAEALGTGMLVCAVIGSGIMADRLTDDVALALLANTGATAAALYVLITVLGPVSGAQFNPVVTMVCAMRREMMPGFALACVIAQVLGGLCGTGLAHAMFDLPILQLSTTLRSGPAQLIAEAVASFGLIVAIFGALRAPGAPVAATVAAYIAAAYWFTSSTSFANPAVALARTFSDTFAGIHPASLPGFVAAEVVGAALGAFFVKWLYAPEAARPQC
jgi:glycerol uptake facilitator-like aquaporin